MSEGLSNYLRMHHPTLTAEELEITDTPGFWRVKGGCPGGDDCKHAFRGALGRCAGGDLTVYVAEPRVRDRHGRFVSPYRIWREAKEQQP